MKNVILGGVCTCALALSPIASSTAEAAIFTFAFMNDSLDSYEALAL
jgi:hypothetical protein